MPVLVVVRFCVVCVPVQDNAELFAMMEKTRMYIFRNLDPEVGQNGPLFSILFHKEKALSFCCYSQSLFIHRKAIF